MSDQPEKSESQTDSSGSRGRSRGLIAWWEKQTENGYREPLMRYAGHIGLLAIIAVGIWAARAGLNRFPLDEVVGPEVAVEAVEQIALPEDQLSISDLPPFVINNGQDQVIARAPDPFTVIPSRPRMEVVSYQVQQGDTLFGIAEKYGLTPETILWGNFDTLEDNPHNISPGQELNILPVDGTIYQWHEGDGLSGVADFFGVVATEIIDWPGNNLDPLTDLSNPNIESGVWLVVPGGQREFQSWRAPAATRSNPAVAGVSGPGACGQIYDGPIGNGTFVWPTPGQSISGFVYSDYHPGVDIGGSTGNAIYAVDSGVVVYAGWNNYGYGNLVIVDHGNGWQTLYAHLSSQNVGCGQAVFQGNVIAGMGCTGNCSGTHLHFEMRSDIYGRVNPSLYLP